MFDRVLVWWKGLKWYWQILAGVLLALVFILAIVLWVLSGGKAGGLDLKQTRALDELRQKQTDAKLAEQEAAVEASKKETEQHLAEAVKKETEREKIEVDAAETDKKLADMGNPSVDELNEWRRKHGV